MFVRWDYLHAWRINLHLPQTTCLLIGQSGGVTVGYSDVTAMINFVFLLLLRLHAKWELHTIFRFS